MDKDGILKYKTRYVTASDSLYENTRKEQKADLTYIDDTFETGVVEPHKVLRLGLGNEIVNSPAEQIITSNPQAFVECSRVDVAERIGKVLNEWISILRRQNPNPFKETVKNKLSRGENYIETVHNKEWLKGHYGLPVLFLIHDPMVLYGSPEEDINGIPDRVLVFYERQAWDVILKYPDWTNPKKSERKIEWFAYLDKDTRYFEADGEPVLKSQKNIYGFTSFVRKYSGFGRRSFDGEISNLIVSDIRNSRGLINEICTMRSDIASVMHLSAHKPKTVFAAGEVKEEDIRENLSFGAYDLNILQNLGDLSQFKIDDVNIEVPSREAFQHTSDIMGELTRRHPYIMSGFPWGTSGRQQNITDVSAMRRYDTVIENTENEWATAFEMALKLCKAIPTLLPDSLQKKDLEYPIKVSVKLKASDPIEEDRLSTLGSRLLLNSEIDPMTNLIQYKGYTQDEAKKILVNSLMWKVLLGSPDIIELIGLRAAEKSGLAEQLQGIRARRQQAEGVPKTTQERIGGEVQTAVGREMGTEGTRGARQSPERYTR